MFLELITILFVIILSLVLCWKDKDNNCMFSHILVGLSGIVFYKLATTYKLSSLIQPKTTENFYDFQTDINNFIANAQGSVISQNVAESLKPGELANYNQKIDNLINALRDYTNAVNNPSTNTGVSSDNLQQLSLDAQQQYQMFQIDYLNKQLQNMKNIINTSTVDNNSKNYKPIKVFSSCVVSNADGTTISNIPISQRQVVSGSSNPIQQSLETINNTASQSSTGSGPSLMFGTPEPGANSDSGILGSILKSLGTRGASVNISQ
jgi:hypothetical protein